MYVNGREHAGHIIHMYKYCPFEGACSFRAETTFRRKTDALTNSDDAKER